MKLLVSFSVVIFASTVFAANALPSKKKNVASPETAIEDQPIAAKLVVDSGPEPETALPLVTEQTLIEANADKIAPKAAEVAKLPENQIPVLAGTKSEKKASGGNFSRIMITLGVLAAVFAGLTYGLRRMAARRGKNSNNTKIKVLTQHALGPKKSIAIIQVAGESILVGITDHNISMLKTIALIDDEFPEDVPRNFEATLNGYDIEEDAPIQSSNHNQPKRRTPVQEDDFAMRGLTEIRDKVSTRLRNMKNL